MNFYAFTKHSASFDSKLKKVISLTKEYKIYDAFFEWHAQIEECRHLRNIISHGSWEWRGWLQKPIHFHAPEIEGGKGAFTTEEFRDKLIYLKNVAETFEAIRTPLEIALDKAAQSGSGEP